MLFDPIYECLAPNHKTETLCQPFVVTSSVMHIVTFSQNNNSLSQLQVSHHPRYLNSSRGKENYQEPINQGQR